MSAFIPQPNFIVPTAPAGDRSNRVASTEFVGSAVGTAAFIANYIGGADQTGMTNGTFTIMQLGTTVWNVGNFYNTATFQVTPPAGYVNLFAAGVPYSTLTTTSLIVISFHKNGTRYRDGFYAGSAVGIGGGVLSIVERCDGTTPYDVRLFANSVGATFYNSGGTTLSYFGAQWLRGL